MKLVYVAGPYRADTEHGVHRNIQRAEAVAYQVWKLGCACICPHKNTAYFGGELPDRTWLDGDIEMILRCDAVVLVKGWEQSSGTRAEIESCRAAGIPVFKTLDELWVWVDA